MITFGEKWFWLDCDYINQSVEYNDFQGGFSRKHQLLSREICKSEFILKTLGEFKKVHKFGDGGIVSVHVQTSVFNELKTSTTSKRRNSITGQGVH